MGQSARRAPRSDEGNLQALHSVNMPDFQRQGKSFGAATSLLGLKRKYFGDVSDDVATLLALKPEGHFFC